MKDLTIDEKIELASILSTSPDTLTKLSEDKYEYVKTAAKTALEEKTNENK